MEGVFEEVEKFPHVSEVASPYGKGGAAAISEDGKIAYATIQYDAAEQARQSEHRRIIHDAQEASGAGSK